MIIGPSILKLFRLAELGDKSSSLFLVVTVSITESSDEISLFDIQHCGNVDEEEEYDDDEVKEGVDEEGYGNEPTDFPDGLGVTDVLIDPNEHLSIW
jgi:hypothetical protein